MSQLICQDFDQKQTLDNYNLAWIRRISIIKFKYLFYAWSKKQIIQTINLNIIKWTLIFQIKFLFSNIANEWSKNPTDKTF